MATNFKVGDSVRIKPNADRIRVDPDPVFVEEMNEFLGTVQKIDELPLFEPNWVTIGRFTYHVDWLEPAKKKQFI